MFIKIKGGKSDPQQKVKRKHYYPRRQKKGTRTTKKFPNQHYDTPRPKSQGICALVASRRKAPWEVEVSKRDEWRELVAFEISEARLVNTGSRKPQDFLQQLIGEYKKSKIKESQSTESVFTEFSNARRLENTDSSEPNDFLQQLIGEYKNAKTAETKDSQSTKSIFTEIFEATRLENTDSRKPNDFLQQLIGKCKKSKTEELQSTKSVFTKILEDEIEEEDMSFMFASRSFPGPLQCSNDMCRRKHPRAFLSSVGKVCKHCGGRDFNVGQQASRQDKGCSSQSISFLDRHYFKREKESEDIGYSYLKPNTRFLDSHKSNHKGDCEDKGCSSQCNSFLDRYYFKREKESEDSGISSSQPNTRSLDRHSKSSDKRDREDKGCSSQYSITFKKEKGSSEDIDCSSSQPNTRLLHSYKSNDKGDSEDKGSISSLVPCLLDRNFQREKDLDADKGATELTVFPKPLTTAEYMARVKEVQKSRRVMTMEEYFSKYGKQ